MKVIYRILLTAGIIAALFSCTPEKEQQEQEQQQKQPEPEPDPNPDPDPDTDPDPDPKPVPEDGSATYPYLISDKDKLNAVGEKLVAGEMVYFKLTDDIDLDGEEWTPLDQSGTASVDFNGDGHVISNFTISGNGEIGFFSKLSGSVHDLTLSNCTINSTYRRVGALAGMLNGGKIIRCGVESDVTVSSSSYDVAGLVGIASDAFTIDNSYSRASVSGSDQVGGLIGRLYGTGTVSSCYASGQLSTTSGTKKGGLVGSIERKGTVSKCISWYSDLELYGANTGGGVLTDNYLKSASETGTVSSHAQEEPRNWSAEIWDFSTPFPTIKGIASGGDTPTPSNAIYLLPYPAEMTPGEGTFSVYGADVYYDGGMDGSIVAKVIDPFASRLSKAAAPSSTPQNGFNFLIDTTLPKEAYSLEVTSSKVVVKASSREGFFYAVQTIRQLLPTAVYGTGPVTSQWTLPCVSIIDRPRFGYRGMHLDVSRHFFGVDDIKRYLDILAIYKINRFHWHLTDDQGWRIAIEKYPYLTTTGATRNGTMVGKDFNSNDGVTYGPYFFTKEQIREIVSYADDRCITVVPEIDLPGHMIAAQAAYHSLGCNPSTDYQVWTKWGVSSDALCLGKSTTWDFLHDVLDEVSELFPGEYIHIGGDEVPTNVSWKNCSDCQAFIGTLGFPTVSGVTAVKQLQYYTAKEIQAYLATKGKKVICWQETFGGIGPNDGSKDIIPGFRVSDFASKGGVIMSWTSSSVGISAAKAGVNAIMAPSWGCYFDCRQSDDGTEPLSGNANGDRAVTMTNAYSLNPLASVPSANESYVLGAEGALWTEYITTSSHLFYMLLPRLTALSENCWTPLESKDLGRVKTSLSKKHFGIYDTLGYNYRSKLDF